MIETETVLILGAGASMHAGYPSGVDLIRKLCGHLPDGVRIPPTVNPGHYELFQHKLRHSATESIDSFLQFNPEFSTIGKYCITAHLKSAELLGPLFQPGKRTWYNALLDSLLVDGRPQFELNKLSIVTFNYDRSLEAFLHTALQNRFNLKSDQAYEALQHLPIIHVYGELGAYPDVPYQQEKDFGELFRISAGINIIHEVDDRKEPFCNQAFARAHEKLLRCYRVYFLGFGFHRDNLKRFKFFKRGDPKAPTVRSTNVGIRGVRYSQLQRLLGEFGIDSGSVPKEYDVDCEHFFEMKWALD